MNKVYCDTSAYQKWLKDLADKGMIIIVHFPYEQKNNKIKNKISPTEPTWNQMNLTWGECSFTWKSMEASEKYSNIKNILKNVGHNTSVDVQHLDCAYKNGCNVFMTNDKNDILSNRQKLEPLLNLRIFHSTEEIKDATEYINSIKK